MSNAMRSGKRALAGIAAGALAVGFVSYAGATSATADTSTGTVSPVRYVGATDDTAVSLTPAAYISWPGNSLGAGSTIQLIGTSAGGGTGQLVVDDSLGAGARANLTTWNSADDTTTADGALFGTDATTDDSFIRIKAGGAGLYQGRIYNGDDTVNFQFTTSGPVASVTLTPATQSVLVGGTATLTAAVFDANSNPTQLASSNESFVLSTSGAGASVPAGIDATDLTTGSYEFEATGVASGSTTVTATGAGALVGKTASATVTGSGSVSDDTVSDMVVEGSSMVWNKPGVTDAQWEAQIKSGAFTNLTVSIEDTTVNTTPEPLSFGISTTAGSVTVDGKTAVPGTDAVVQVTPAAGAASLSLALGGGAGFNGSVITISQLNVAGGTVGADLTITPVIPTNTATATPSGSAVAKIGDTTSVVVSVDDSLGDPVSGAAIAAYKTGTQSAANLLSTGTTGSDGKATVTVSCSTCTTNNSTSTYSFALNGTNIGATSTSTQLTVTYTTDGTVSDLTVTDTVGSFTAGGTAPTTFPAMYIPGEGSASGKLGTTQSAGTYNSIATTPAPTGMTGNWVSLRAVTTPANSFSVSTTDSGVCFSTTAPVSTDLWNTDCSTSVSASNDDSVFMWATETGLFTYTVESGGKSVSNSAVVANTFNDAYNVGISPDSATVGRGSINTVVVTVQDMFGNPVQAAGTTSGDDTGALTVTAAGEILLGGFVSSNSFATDENGQATVTYIAGNSSGSGTLTVTPKASNPAPAWQTTYVAPTGKDAPRTSAASAITVTGDASKSITIVGQRGTVKGKPGVMVDGLTTGFAEGDVVVPWIKFPGQTSYSAGTSRPAIDADGEFYWQRKTGKKIYILFKNEDGTVKSDRIIIQAK